MSSTFVTARQSLPGMASKLSWSIVMVAAPYPTKLPTPQKVSDGQGALEASCPCGNSAVKDPCTPGCAAAGSAPARATTGATSATAPSIEVVRMASPQADSWKFVDAIARPRPGRSVYRTWVNSRRSPRLLFIVRGSDGLAVRDRAADVLTEGAPVADNAADSAADSNAADYDDFFRLHYAHVV